MREQYKVKNRVEQISNEKLAKDIELCMSLDEF